MFVSRKIYRQLIRKKTFSWNRYNFVSGSQHDVLMPNVMDAKDGVIEKWLKKAGDKFSANDVLCEATLSDVTIAIEGGREGIVARILISEGKTVEVGTPIAIVVDDRDSLNDFLEEDRHAVIESSMLQNVKDTEQKADVKILLRELKHLLNDGKIAEGTG